jgi:hypothetical protein
MNQAKPGDWYFFAQCRKCHNDILFRKAPSPEEEERPIVQGTTTTCPRCKAVHSYAASEVQRGQVEDNT